MTISRSSLLTICFSGAAILLLAISCAPRESLELEKGTFEPSGLEKEAFYEEYTGFVQALTSLSGRANVQVSEPDGTERLTIRFRSDRNESLITIRNNLGIEGGRIYSDPDSVIIYNRIEEVAHTMSHTDAARFYLDGITAMNLIRILHPIPDVDVISRILENDEFYLVETRYGERHYFRRTDMALHLTERDTEHPEAYKSFYFENHAEIDGHVLPRRLRILSSDEKSNIFLVIRALEINPEDLVFDPEIPGDIDIVRL